MFSSRRRRLPRALLAAAALLAVYFVYVNKEKLLGPDGNPFGGAASDGAGSSGNGAAGVANGGGGGSSSGGSNGGGAIAKKADSEVGGSSSDTLTVSGVKAHVIHIPKLHATDVFPLADAKHLHGQVGVRADGTPAFTVVPMVGEETMEDKRKHHKGNCFNLARSDSLPLDRDVPDVKSSKCPAKYPGRLPATSVVFVFFNEPASPLYRSIHSVLNRSPPELLHEIVLVDDGSDAPWLQQPLEDYVALLPKVKLVRMEKRLGLMATRVMGAMVATGETVTFLDAHIEVNEGWLEPLMARIGEDRRHVVMPIIDSLDADSFDYHSGGLDILAFSWSLGQKGISRRRTEVEPMPSPIMAGGLFSMDRKLFFELGAYDPEMRLYGGEEMEISFRIWQCGCTLECIPCSRVGHVFRTGRYWQGQVYPVPGEVIVKNKLRAAEVWMDEYKTIVKRVMPPLPAGMELGPLDYMLNIREKHKCKTFKWYLENVYPEMFVPMDPSFMRYQGEIRNPAKKACIDTLGATGPGAPIGAYPCHGSHGTQEFVFSRKGEVRVASMDYDTCVDAGGQTDVRIWSCHDQRGNQEWGYDEKTGQISVGDRCMTVSEESTPRSPFSLKLAKCEENNKMQEWRFSK